MSTNFIVAVTPLQERLSAIAHEKHSSPRTHRFYGFREDQSDLPVVRLPISLPVYRLANYRTNILQLRWVKEKKTANTFFSTGEENDSAQKIQHEFLWNLAQTERESITSIIDTLIKEKQRDPILITVSGVVVNGNRRLAAMRELYTESPEKYASFSHVDCMVLPESANENDLKDIEVRLQMTPETRLPYGWINECIAIKDLKESGRSLDTIGGLMRLDAPRVKDKLLMLDEIDLYLRDWKDAEFDYDSLNNAEEIISQMTMRLRRKEGIEKEISRRLGWILLDQRGKDGRVYELREAIGNLTQAVTSKLQEVYPVEMDDEEVENNETLEFDLGQADVTLPEQKVVSFLDKCKEDQKLQEDVVNVCRAVIEAQKVQQKGNAALKALTDAHTKLLEIDFTSADPTTFAAIAKQIDSIEQRVGNLKSEFSKYQ